MSYMLMVNSSVCKW